jgi:hypothetical protein
MKYKKILISSAFSLILFGCDGSSSTTPVSTTPTEVMPIGVWEGEVVTDSETYQAVGLVAPDGEASFVLDFAEQNKVIITLSGSNFSGDVLAYGSDGFLLGAGTISGSYSSSSITGSTKVNGDVISSFSFSLSDESSYGASLDTIEGNYISLDGVTSISIVDGVLTGLDPYGCQYNGNITIPDSSVNVYRVLLNVSDCGDFSNQYTGLATYATYSKDSSEKGFILQIDNGVYALTDVIIK